MPNLAPRSCFFTINETNAVHSKKKWASVRNQRQAAAIDSTAAAASVAAARGTGIPTFHVKTKHFEIAVIRDFHR